MDYFQAIVAEWLTSDGRTLIAPEYGLRVSHLEKFKDKDQKVMWPDIVAIRPAAKEAFICEVTWSKKWSEIEDKLRRYDERMPVIKSSLEHWLGIDPQWPLSLWYFVPEDHIERIASRCPATLALRLTALERIRPWTYVHGWRAPDDEVQEA